MGNFIYRIALGVQENNNILKFLICHFDFCILLFNLCAFLFNLCALFFKCRFLFLNFCILEHDGGVPVFYFGEDFIFHLHGSAHVRSGGSLDETVHDKLLVIAIEFPFIDFQKMPVLFPTVILVEDVQQAFQVIARAPFQVRDLHDDGVVRQAFDEGVGHAVGYGVGVVVKIAAADIDNGFLQIAQFVPQDVDGYHGKAEALGIFIARRYVLLIEVLRAEVLPETQGLGGKPCLLQFNQDEVLLPVFFSYLGREVNAEQGDGLPAQVGVFVLAHLHFHHLFLQ